MTRREFIKGIIKTRKYLMKSKTGFKNFAKCTKIIKDLELQISAYGHKWDSEGWRKFLNRKKEEITYLIPGNKAMQHKIEQLNALL